MAEMMFIVEKEGENAILRASQCPNFASFLAAIRGKLRDLLSDDFPLKFVLEPKQLSSVESQQDFENVILLCQNLQRCVVNFTIPANFTTANAGTNSLSAPRNENVPTQKQKSKRRLPEKGRNEGECATGPVIVYDDAPVQDNRSLLNASTEKQKSKRKQPEEERNVGESATSPIPVYDVDLQQESTPLLNAPNEKQRSKRKLSEEERSGGEYATSSIQLYDIDPPQDSRSFQNVPTEKQKLPEEERNEGECATSSAPFYDVAPQQDSSSLPNASKRKLPEEERNEGECVTSRLPLYDISPQQHSRPLLNAPTEKQTYKRNEGQCATSRIPLGNVAPQQDNTSLLSADWVNKITHVGQEFPGGVVDFRCQLAKYAAKVGFKFRYIRNEAVYISAHCSERDKDGCKWFVKGGLSTINKTSFVIKQANLVHTCTLSVEKNGSHRLGAQILGNLMEEKVRTCPKVSPKQIKDHLLCYYGLDVTLHQVWRALEVAKGNIFGYRNYRDTFNELYWYRDAILRTNPGSHVTLETEEGTNRFKRFFVAFNGSLHGFKKCRPMLFVDGINMMKRYKGTLLIATAKDGNNGLFPVAFAVVDVENGDNWIWFLSTLREVIKHEKEIMYLSDRASGLSTAFDMVWERPLHFFCLHHLMKYLRRMYHGIKFSDVFKNKMCKLLKDAAYAPNPSIFNSAIAEFQRQGGETAKHFLFDLPVEKWAVAFAPDLLRYGELTSNAEESFSKWILDLDAYSMPVTYVLDCINTKLVQWFVERREEQKKWTGALTPKMEDMWNALEGLSSSWTISLTTIEGVFKVLSYPSCTVDLNTRTCTCFQWQATGFPCSHAVGCINQARWDIRGIVDACFFNDTYELIYESSIEAIPTAEKNESLDLKAAPSILPPVMRKDTGKPRKKRALSKGEDNKKQFHCGRCGRFGTHLWLTCNDALD